MANAVIGAEIRLEGEKDFKRAVSSINTDLKVLGSELKKTESEYKGNENSLSALTAKSEQYNKIAEAQRKKIEILHTAVEKSRAKYTAAGQNVEKYRKELSDAEKELDRLKNTEGTTTEEITEQEKAVANLSKKLETAEKGYATAEKQTKNWEVSLNRAEAELNDTERELKETDAALREMGSGAKYSKEQIEQAESTLRDFGQKAQPAVNAAKTALKSIAAVTAAVAGASAAVVKKSVDIGGDFESQMSKVKAISGATQSEMEQLTAKAKEMGGSTKFTAKQAGEALEYMSMAGWKTSDMLSGIGGIMHLAAASGEDLGRTSDIVTDALTAFGMKAGDAGHFADVLAAASSNANTNVGMMGETFKYVGAAAGALHYSAEDVGLSIGLMANAGIKASQAGTELNSIYTRLAVNTNGARDAIEDLGIKFYTSDGKARAWGTILDQLRAKTANMTDAEKTAFANRVAGQRAQAGLIAMLNATSADYDKLTKSINNADGAAKRMADTMQDNLQGQLTVLKSGLEGAAISIYDEMKKPMTEGVQTIVTTLNDPRIQAGIKSVGKQFGELFAGVASFAAKNAPDFIKGFQKVTEYLSSSSFKSGVKAGGELLMNTGKVAVEIGKVGFPVLAKSTELLAKSGKVLIPVLAAGYTGFKAFQIVKTTTELVKGAGAAFQALNVVMMANPWALAIGGIAAVTVALVGIAATSSEAEDKYADLSEQVKETSDSMKDMAQARKDSYDDSYKEIYQVENLRDRLNELVDKNGKLIGKKEELQSVVKRLNEKGFTVELNKTGDLVKNYKDLNKQLSNYLEQKQYQAKITSLEPEYQEFKVNIKKYHSQTKEAQAAYDPEYSKLLGVDTHGWLVDPTQLWDEAGNFTDYYRDIVNDLGAFSDQFENAAEAARGRYVDYTQSLKTEETALKLINAVDQAYLLAGQGKYAEANKVLQDYFDERDATFKKAADYEKSQRDKAIKDLGDQLLDEVNLHKVYLETGSKEMIDASIGYIEQAADELAKVGKKIPDGIIEGLKNGTLSVDDAMQQIQEIIKNDGKVDLTEEGVEISDTLSDGLKLGIDTVAGAGAELVDSAVKPMGAPTPKAEAKQEGQETGKAYAEGVEGKKGSAKTAGTDLAASSVDGLASKKSEAAAQGTMTADSFWKAVEIMKAQSNAAGKTNAAAAINGMKSAESKAASAGQSVGSAFSKGIPKGIDQYVSSIKKSAVNAVNVALAAARKAAEINSPSKKSGDLVGKPLAEGVAVGYEKGASAAAKRISASTSAIIEKMRSASASAAAKLSDSSSSGGFGRSGQSGSVSKTINIHYDNQFNGASARDGEAMLRQLDRALGAKL